MSFIEFEALRANWKLVLGPFDSTHIWRELLLGIQDPEGRGDVLRLLGWVHLTSATGVHLWVWVNAWALAARLVAQRWASPRRWRLIYWTGLTLGGATALFLWALAGLRWGWLRPWLVWAIRRMAEAAGMRMSAFSPLFIALGVEGLMALFHSSEWISAPWAWGRVHYALAVGGGIVGADWAKAWLKNSRNSKLILKEAALHVGMSVGSWLPIAGLDLVAHGWFSGATPFLSLVTLGLGVAIFYPVLVMFLLLGWDVPAQWVTQTGTYGIEALTRFVVTHQYFTLWVGFPAALLGLILSFLTLLGWSQTKQVTARVGVLLLATTIALSFRHYEQKKKFQGLDSESIRLISVGQGDSSEIRTAHWKGWIDTGPPPRKGSDSPLTSAQWMLRAARVGSMPSLLVTHGDSDHTGGVEALSRVVELSCAQCAEGWSPRLRARFPQLPWHSIRDSSSQGCFPFPHWESAPRKRNGSMLGVAVPLQSGAVYLAVGDAGSKEELEFLGWARNLGWLDRYPKIWKVSHHGSRFSSSDGVVSTVKPERAWISVGRYNRFGHPAPSVVQKWKLVAQKVQRTDQEREDLVYPETRYMLSK